MRCLGPLSFARGAAALALLAVLSPPLCAEEEAELVWMTPDAVREAIVGHPVTGLYNDGRKWFERMHADGTTQLSEENEAAKQGRWKFEADGELCFIYEDREGSGGCFHYVLRGTNCYEHYFWEEEDENGPAEWVSNGRLWRTNEPTVCVDLPSS